MTNGYEGVLYIYQSSRTGTSPSVTIKYHTQKILFGGILLFFIGFSQRILSPADRVILMSLFSCGCVNTTVRKHHVGANKTSTKARWELSKNAMTYLEQILEATPDETTTIRPLRKNYPSKTNQTCGPLLEKQGRSPM